MTPIRLLRSGIDVTPMQRALAENPNLWDRQSARTSPITSPHHGLSDIWVRYADQSTYQADGSHDSVWYEPADYLPVRDMVYSLMAEVKGEHLGGVLITKIPAGRTCKKHIDPGWHAARYSKFAIQIAADPETQAFCFPGVELKTKPGDLFWFNNHYEHWVTNDGPHDRITMIVCIRTEHTHTERPKN